MRQQDSLKAYDRTSEAESRAMSAALDQDPARAPLKPIQPQAVSPANCIASCPPAPGPPAEVALNAPGAHFHNVTFNTFVRKPRLSLKLKRKRKD